MGNLLIYITNVIFQLLAMNTVFKLPYSFSTAILTENSFHYTFYFFGNSDIHECPLT